MEKNFTGHPDNVSSMQQDLSLKERLGYGIGVFPQELHINCVILYLLYYYTDVFSISAQVAGIIIFASRAVQALMNPVIGLFSDRLNTRWGSKRPFLLFGAVPLGLFFFMVFAGPSLSGSIKIIYASVTSLLYFMAFSIVAIPYNALTAVLTHNSHQRSLLSGSRMIFALLGALAAAGMLRPLVALFESERDGYRWISMLFGVLGSAVLIFSFMNVKERCAGPQERQRSTLFRDFRLVIKNRPFLILAAATTFFVLGTNTMGTAVNYYFKYNLGAETLIPVAFLCIFLSSAISIPVFLRISKRFGKKRAFIAGMLLVCAVLAATFFIEEPDPYLIMIFLAIAGAGVSTVFLSPWAMVPDTVEFLQWKTGQRREGLIYGYFLLFFNTSAALTGFVAGSALEYAGYVPNVAQDPSTLLGIRVILTIIPMVFILIGILLLMLYPINEDMHADMVTEIEGRT